MKYVVVVVRDSAAVVYGVPMFVGSIGAAIRSFSDEVQNPREGNMLNKHPEDFELYHLGDYDDAVAEFMTEGPPKLLIRGQDCRKM